MLPSEDSLPVSAIFAVLRSAAVIWWRSGIACGSSRQEREWIDVGLGFADPDPEVHVRQVVLGLARGARLRDGEALRHVLSLVDEQPAEVGERSPVAVRGRDRHGASVCRELAGERDFSRGRRAHRSSADDADVDAAMLPCGIGVVAERESAEDRAVRGPCPSERRRHRDQRPGRHHGDD